MGIDKNQRIIIIGAGAFGLGTALRLVEEGYRSVTVLDRAVPPVPDGSSTDISRVIRFDYGDDVYARMGKEAYDLWKTPAYNNAFYPAPVLWVTQDSSPEIEVQATAVEYSRKTRQALVNIGESYTDVRTPEEARNRFPTLSGPLATPGFDGFYNTSAGWADSGAAIARMVSRCCAAGVSFITGPNGQVTGFEKESDGKIRAVRTANGGSVSGDLFIAATGAWTGSLIPSWNSMIAAAQIVGYCRLTHAEMERLKDLPIYFNLSTGFFIFPPHEGTGYLKVACHGYGYTVSSPGTVSAPPTLAPSTRANYVPADGYNRLLAGLKSVVPDIAKRGFEKVGLCWYNDTPTGDFIFDFHPEHSNLFIATGGSGQ